MEYVGGIKGEVETSFPKKFGEVETSLPRRGDLEAKIYLRLWQDEVETSLP
ncbi:MAG: hypothetical protein WC279_03105 [Sulfurimonas sp.]|uniref:hypothetical protein n=1 Tax=Sulfurimonas sp. TaxID=2022749 RepID=UPI00356A7315